MSYLSELNEQEIYRLCEAIPYDYAKYYFQYNSKQFAKIRPGFRAKSLSEEAVKSIFKHNYKNRFISSFLENSIHRWLGEIEDALKEEKEKNKPDFVAYIIVLAESFFAKNISAYFKLIQSDYTTETINLIAEMVAEMTEINKQTEKLRKCVDEDQKAIEALSDDLEEYEKKANSSKKAEKEKRQLEKRITNLVNELNKKITEIDILKTATKQIEKEKNSYVEKIKALKNQIKEIEQKNSDLSKEISEGKYQKKLALETIEGVYEVTAPKDCDEFIDILDSNFISIGLNDEFLYPNMLSFFIYKGICTGKPFVVKNTVAKSLISCLSNTIIGTKNYDALYYEASITESDIISFLQNSNRIVLFNNFIGNYNDTLLLSILEKFKNKIVFISTAYENSLRYVSEEFFEYVTYLGVSCFNCFEKNLKPDEDPYECDEIIAHSSTINNIYSKRIDKIISEISASLRIENNGKQFVTDDSSLAGYLYFSLMPYCEIILGVNPFNYSKTMQKFFAENGRSTYKDIFKRWY